MVECVDDFFRSSLGFSRGAFSFCWERGGFSFARGGREEGSLIFLSFPLQLEGESLFICLPLTLCHSSFPFHERSRIFGCSSPGFLPGGLFRFGGKSQLFLFFSCNWGGDPYLSGTSVKWN